MTNRQFRAWRKRHFGDAHGARSECARALGLDRETIASLETGRTRNGNPYPVAAHVALACAAWTIGLRAYDGGPVRLGRVA